MKKNNSLVEYKLLLKKLSKWRFIALFLIVIVFFRALSAEGESRFFSSPYIAMVEISGFIADNYERNKKLSSLGKDQEVEAIIVKINSPGGTFVGGEKLYNILGKIAKQKPVVAILGDQATSAAYLAAVGANHIIASNGSLTGSVGVLLQSVEVTDLVKKIGVNPVIIKSNKYKAMPHPAEKLDLEGEEYLQELVNQSQEIFFNLVKDKRVDISDENLLEVAKGKVFIGRTAKKIGLVDEIGDIDNAKLWLVSKGVESKEIIKLDLLNKNKSIKSLLNGFNFHNMNSTGLKLLSVF